MKFVEPKEALVKKPAKDSFDPKSFLAKVGTGKTILEFHKNQHVFEQGDIAEHRSARFDRLRRLTRYRLTAEDFTVITRAIFLTFGQWCAAKSIACGNVRGEQPRASASENSGDPKDRPPAKSLSPSFQKGSVSVLIFGSPSSR
jgi:hypothetical protein